MDYNCKICKKDYKSYNSLWNHNKKYHSNIVKPKCNPNEQSVNQNELNKKMYSCKVCNKEFKYSQSRSRHEKKCNKNKNDEIKEMKDKIDILLKMLKIHPKKLEKINKQLNNNGTINNTTNNTVNNTINNIIIPYESQNLKGILKETEKLQILKSGSQAHLKLTDILYKNPEYEKFRNIYITNLSNDIGYIYDEKEKRFIVKSKKDIISNYGEVRLSDIEEFYEELGNKVDKYNLQRLKDLVYNYFNDATFKNDKNKEMLISLYNNKIHVEQIYKQINELEL